MLEDCNQCSLERAGAVGMCVASSSPVPHDGGAGCEVEAGGVHPSAGLMQGEPEADEAGADGQAEFQQEAEQEIVLSL